MVARQMHLAGGPLDLLCLDSDGALVVVELKKGRLYREAVAQALDYAASISAMPGDLLQKRLEDYLGKHPDPVASERLREQAQLEIDKGERRDISILIAGTRRDAGFDRVSEFLESQGIPIRVVTFQVLDLGGEGVVLVREAKEAEPPPPPPPKYTWEAVLANAERHGVALLMEAIKEAGDRNGLYARPWKVTLGLTSLENRRSTLFAAWPRGSVPGSVGVDIAPSTIAESFSVNEDDIRKVFGHDTRLSLDAAGIEDFVRNMDRFFSSLNETDTDVPGGE